MSSLKDKIFISLLSAAVFVVVNLPQTYKLTDKVLPFDTWSESDKSPTDLGRVAHTLVFFSLTLLSMLKSDQDMMVKVKHSLYATLIFFAMSSKTFSGLTKPVVKKLVGSDYEIEDDSVPLVLYNASLYFVALVAVMYLP